MDEPLTTLTVKLDHFTPQGTPMVRLPNGLLLAGDQEIKTLSPKVGDILVYSSGWEIASDESWEVKAQIGVIEQKSGPDEILIKTPDGYSHKLVHRNARWSLGDYALFNESSSILRVIPQEAARKSTIEDEASASKFRIDLDPERFQWDYFVGSHEILTDAKQIVELYTTLEGRELISQMKVDPVHGILFAGPPGTGKTFLAQIMAAQSGSAFYLVTTASLGGQLVGQSEERLEAIYEDAAKQEMSIIFVDEIDVLTKDRSNAYENGSRLVNVFLTNMDGVGAPENVLTIGATNRISDIDRALRRPGRFDREVYFRLPNQMDRLEILKSRTPTLASNIDFDKISSQTEGWTAAELRSILQYSGELAVIEGRSRIYNDHFLLGFEKATTARNARKGEEK
ncbi:ATP-binding protein [Corynebacterium sp. UMB6689]|uniref:ATP-binding protein n=1 Tax=unclassified Corynebacterium TaxID=2624378 RepID=UPI00114CAF0E|nr:MULTISPECIES: ATP-binding protein [unclassified Corynebacterium]MDK6813914.1 ATP-binding protein [Corynebacterium sp. UMB6689]